MAPGYVDAEALRALPGLKIGVVLPPEPDPAVIAALAAPACIGGYDGYTWFETLPRSIRGMRFAQVLPPVVDIERALPAPRLDRCTIVAPTGALPYDLRGRGDVARLEEDASTDAIRSLLSEGGVFACWSKRRDVRLEALAVAALANGLLVVSNRELPTEWGIEVEDEYLVRSGGDDFVAAISAPSAGRGSFAPLRVRAWQKIRECLSASSAFERLAHDALLALAPTELAARTRAAYVK
jgi:hypothetical protein